MIDSGGQEQQIEMLVDVLCKRLAEVLPRNRFEVRVENHAVRICGLAERRGDTIWVTPIAIWKSELPVEDRLQIFLETASRHVQNFVSRHDRPWPTKTAKPRVSIDEDNIFVWWGGLCRTDAVAALHPISRKEIGV